MGDPLEVGRASNTVCDHCHRPLCESLFIRSAGSLQHIHLRCFQSADPRPLSLLEDIDLVTPLLAGDLPQVMAWLAHHNEQFRLTEASIPKRFSSKSVQSCGSVLKRPLLEAFAFLIAEEIETAARVCRSWLHASRDNELWRRLLNDDSCVDCRAQFIAQRLNSCWNCLRLKPLSDVARMDSALQRPLCKACARTDAGLVLHLKDIRKLGMHKRLLRQVRFFRHKETGRKATFLALLCRKVLPHLEARRVWLLTRVAQCGSDAEDIEEVLRTVDFKRVLRTGVMPANRLYRAVLLFCGDVSEASFTAFQRNMDK